MQQQRNLILFIVLSMAVLFGWPIIAQKLGLLPPPRPKAKANVAKVDDKAKADEAAGKPATGEDAKPGDQPKDGAGGGEAKGGAPGEDKKSDAENVVQAPAKERPVFPRQTVTLGSLDMRSPFFLSVELTSQGASVENIQLNDDRYRDLENPKDQLKVVGNVSHRAANKEPALRTFETHIPEFDRELSKDGKTSADVDWELVETTADPENPAVKTGATFRYQSLDGSLVVLKHFTVHKSDKHEPAELAAARENDPAPYKLQMRLEFQNKSQKQTSLSYLLQGPVGLPLENEISTRKFRDLKMAFIQDDGSIKPNYLSADGLSREYVKAQQNNDPKLIDEWKRPIKFLGIDVQYFTALIFPGGDQLKSPTTEAARPVLLGTPSSEGFGTRMAWFFMPWKQVNSKLDLTVELESKPIELAAGAQPVEHTYDLYAGPKIPTLLTALEAESALDFGWFGKISQGMLWIMRHLHDLGIPYGLAVVCLTILVRGCMVPLSLKQAAGAKRMKELQPKLAELKKKYENDREKFARAQMELFQQHNYNPLSGCLPVFIQLPVFMGLYQALNSSVDLRMAPFLWFGNLAAPDKLFTLPIQLPIIAQFFNLLPLITVSLFVVQQKMFMPPPTDEQQAMQYKMMNYMMVFMGAMFYHVPAGLCVYFIASSLWGMAERKLLDLRSKSQPATTPPPEQSSGGKGPGGGPTKPSGPAPERRSGLAAGIWKKLLETADAAGSQTAVSDRRDTSEPTNGKKKDRKSRR